MPIDIEDFVRWAVKDELPKQPRPEAPTAFRAGWEAVSRQGVLLTETVDDGAAARLNEFGVVPLSPEWCRARPHRDALTLNALMLGLDGRDLELPPGWNPLGDMGDLGPLGEAAIARGVEALLAWRAAGRGRAVLRALMVRRAVLGWRDIEAEPARIDWERRPDGREAWFLRDVVTGDGAFAPASYEVERDGWDHARRRPRAGAYRRPVLVPDVAPVVRARGEYELWHAALSWLAEECAAAMPWRGVTGPARPARPWEEARAPQRVLWARLPRDSRGDGAASRRGI